MLVFYLLQALTNLKPLERNKSLVLLFSSGFQRVGSLTLRYHVNLFIVLLYTEPFLEPSVTVLLVLLFNGGRLVGKVQNELKSAWAQDKAKTFLQQGTKTLASSSYRIERSTEKHFQAWQKYSVLLCKVLSLVCRMKQKLAIRPAFSENAQFPFRHLKKWPHWVLSSSGNLWLWGWELSTRKSGPLCVHIHLGVLYKEQLTKEKPNWDNQFVTNSWKGKISRGFLSTEWGIML